MFTYECAKCNPRIIQEFSQIKDKYPQSFMMPPEWPKIVYGATTTYSWTSYDHCPDCWGHKGHAELA